MEKLLKKREGRGQKCLQLYGCGCSCGTCEPVCSGCGSSSANDYENVRSHSSSTNIDIVAMRGMENVLKWG